MTPAQLRVRMINTLVPAHFASSGVYDCPLCGGKQDLHVAVYDSKRPGYLFNFANFCGCEQREVVDEMMRRAHRRRRSRAGRRDERSKN
jgi:hypothetical protein